MVIALRAKLAAILPRLAALRLLLASTTAVLKLLLRKLQSNPLLSIMANYLPWIRQKGCFRAAFFVHQSEA